MAGNGSNTQVIDLCEASPDMPVLSLTKGAGLGGAENVQDGLIQHCLWVVCAMAGLLPLPVIFDVNGVFAGRRTLRP